MAVPSARNSGLDNTLKLFLSICESESSTELSIFCITSAVLTGNVLFSTMIV